MTNLTPMLSELHRIFDALNEKYFNNELPNVFITITPGKKKTSNVYGTFTPDSWLKEKSEENSNEDIKEIYHEISMSAEYFTRPTANWVATLIHEMTHLYCHINKIEDTSNGNRYHNRRFKIEAEKRGLIIEKEDVIGWSVTSPSADLIEFVKTLEIDEDKFKYFRDTKFEMSKPTQKKRYVCPLCGIQVQAKKEANVICGDCMKRMDYWELNDMEIIEDYNGGLYEDSDWYNEM